MAIATTLRNRLVGFLIILSLLLIALPALLGRSPQSLPDDAKPLSTHGAVSQGAEDDGYAALLAPEDDSQEGLISENPELMAQLAQQGSEPQGTVEQLAFNQSPADASSQASGNNAANSNNAADISRPASSSSSQGTTPRGSNQEILTASGRGSSNAEILVANKPAASQSNASRGSGSSSKAPAVTSGSRGSGYTVQVGVFSQRANAERLVSQLKSAGISARTENVTSNGKAMVRVFAGESGDRASLESLVKRIEEVAKVKGRIVPKS